MAVSKKVHSFISQSSWIRKMFEEGIRLKKEFGAENIFDFSLGNPNVSPPDQFRAALIQIAEEDTPGIHGYMSNAGFQETREAVAQTITGEHGISLGAEHVVMTCGAAGALNVLFKVLLDPGDEVLVPTPCFMEYRFYVDNAGGAITFAKTKADFSLDLDALRKAVTEKTKVVLVNFPNNPTGRVYGEASIRGLAALLEEKGRVYGKEIYLASDEPYRDVVYDGVKVPSILAVYKNSIIANSYSKSLSLPGERIGYLAVNPDISGLEEVMGGLIMYNRVLGFVNSPALMQRVIARMQDVKVNVAEYKRKRDLLCDGLSSAGYELAKPEGAFYLFLRSPIEDDIEFVKALQKRRILVVPGSGFGGPGYIRIAYCVDDATIINAMPGFKQTLTELQGRP
jgi:aspartate aminotransferase